jgi:hypothetical protein
VQNVEPAEMPNQVTALFAASAVSFGLSPGATFADIADRLASLGDRHPGTPKAVYLKLAWPGTARNLTALLSTATEGIF